MAAVWVRGMRSTSAAVADEGTTTDQPAPGPAGKRFKLVFSIQQWTQRDEQTQEKRELILRQADGWIDYTKRYDKVGGRKWEAAEI